uniref:RDD domain-containing protein n=1 Tax=Syphacia muris TaxID=451379 RepID=A0A0N5AVP0_9BILA
MALMHSYGYLMSLLNSQSTTLPNSSVQLNSSQQRQNDHSGPAAPTHQYTQRCSVPSFARRFVAELIDFLFAFFIKLLFFHCLVDFGVINEKIDKLLTDDSDLQSLVDITQGLFPLEMLGRVLISFIEALFISYGWGCVPAGSTPGKAIMAIQVIPCYSVTSIPGSNDVNIFALFTRNFFSSLLRSLLKNMLVILLFPLSPAAYVFQFNRAVYDLAAKTIVVFV